MYRTIFPRCTVTGSFKPVPYSHFLQGAIPEKCRNCKNLFEGGCRRALDQVQNYLSLDHGPCPVKGRTHPVIVNNQYYTSKVYVPEKCTQCSYLKLDEVRGFVCNLDRKNIWQDFPRTLDWGIWAPENPNLGLTSGLSVTQEFIKAVEEKNEVAAIKEFRRIHPKTTIKEAREAYAELLQKIDKLA